jgi:hypothetical protein
VASRSRGRDVDCRPERKKIPGNRRLLGADEGGCGGVQPAVLAAVEGGGVSAWIGDHDGSNRSFPQIVLTTICVSLMASPSARALN